MFSFLIKIKKFSALVLYYKKSEKIERRFVIIKISGRLFIVFVLCSIIIMSAIKINSFVNVNFLFINNNCNKLIQGLGKTIQIIGFLVWVIKFGRIENAHGGIIVAPTSALQNWINEISTFANENINIVQLPSKARNRRQIIRAINPDDVIFLNNRQFIPKQTQKTYYVRNYMIYNSTAICSVKYE